MPRQLMHDLFASHVDYSTSIKKVNASAQVYQLSFHCQTDHFVVETPFTYCPQIPDNYLSFSYVTITAAPYRFMAVFSPLQLVLRGPPGLKNLA
jgi:hypothetical protein